MNKAFRTFLAFAFLAYGVIFGLSVRAESHPEHDSTHIHQHEAQANGDHEGHEHHDATEGGHGSQSMDNFDLSEMIIHHISDDKSWHFFTIRHTHVTLPLPIILYSNQRGLMFFMSSKFSGEHHEPVEYNGLKLEHGHVVSTMPGETLLDFSITKNVASMMISAILMLLIFITVAKAYGNNKGAPKGLQSFMEPLILFVRDDVAKPNIGDKTYKYLPYLLTIFFFIWINNLLGLLPGAANLTGNIAVTACLALLTFFITNISGKSTYWGHIFNPPGVPKWLFPIMVPIEMIGLISKPFSLMIRLFANITAGHIIILSIISLVFIFGELGANPGAGLGVAVISTAFGVFLFCLELLVAALQAYIFTMLTSLYIGQAIEEHHHDDHH